MVWHNRHRVKQGMNYFSPAELKSSLKQEMPQEFASLGIEIDDFLSDLIKIRNVEQTSFDVFNQCFKDHLPKINVPTSTPSTSSSEKKSATQQNNPDKPTPSTNLLHKFAIVSNDNKEPNSTIDKPIILKNKETRKHIHRYDLRIGLKECKSDDEEQRVLRGLLEEFLETMLSADQSLLIHPYYELDRSNTSFLDLSKSFKILEVESFSKLQRYFSRLGSRNPNTGFVYCSCIVASSRPHTALMTKVSQNLQESKLSLWPRLCDHENI